VLFDVIADLKSHGVGIIYISHRMEEIFKITDRISVLRDGQYRGTLNTAKTDEEDGHPADDRAQARSDAARQHHELGDVALEVKRLSCGDALLDVSFRFAPGKWWASTALSVPGAPKSPKPCLACATRPAGSILSGRQEVRSHSPADAISLGISLVPENRKGQGLVLGMNCRDNMTLPQVE
jgi:ABC-type sugar transport system ATPase subunit